MAEMPEIDPNFEPQSRPRLGTWPLNRPNIQARRNRGMEMGGTFLDATLEEANSQELIAGDSSMVMEPPPLMKDDYLSLLSPDSMLSQTDLDSVLLGSPPAPNLVTDFSALSGTSAVIKPEPNNNTIIEDYCTTPIMTELSNLDESRSFKDTQTLQKQSTMQIQTTNAVANFSSSSSSLSKSPTNTVSATQSTPGASQKAKSSRKNAWGNMSYADLITQAIEASPEKRLTLAQIYEWMVKNVAYFKDKGDSNSSAGWKNSIRHNLSLHAKFKRIQNEGTGKSSWWVINHDAKPGKSPRRPRAISMDNASAKFNRSRSKVLAKQKADLLKKQKGIETTVSKALGNEYRQRASSNASSIGGRISPQGRFLSQDLEDDGAPPLSISSPLSGSANNLALSSSLPVPSAFNNIFDMTRQDATSTIPETISTDQFMHENLLESLASMDVVSSPGSAYSSQTVMQQMNGSQNSKNLGNSVAQNSPNLASLLQKTPSKASNNKIVQKTTAKAEPQWNDSKAPYPYAEYQNQQMMTQVMQSPPQYKGQMQSQMGDGKPLYHYIQQPQDNSQYGQQVNYISQGSMPQYMNEQQRQQMVQTENSQTPQYQSTNLLQMSQAKFPSDINLDNQELYDSGDLDMNEVLRDMPSPDYSSAYNFGMEFESGGKPASFYNQLQMTQESGTYNTGMSGNAMLQQQQSQQPTMHPNPDIFIANPGSGATSMDMMMEGCRMNNTNFQRMQSGQQPSSVGAAPSYSMQ